MTLEEAIKHCEEKAKELYKQAFLCHANPNDDKLDDCIECADEHEQLAEWLKELKAYKEAPQGDTISREALKEAIKEAQAEGFVEVANAFDCVYDRIDNAPTIEAYTPEQVKDLVDLNKKLSGERPQGEWLQRWKEYECSQCGYFVIPTENWLPNFCPNCGADMRKGGAEND